MVSIALPGHVADEASPLLRAIGSLRHVTMAYSLGGFNIVTAGGAFFERRHFVVGDRFLYPSWERERFDRLKEVLPKVEIFVSHDGLIVPTDTAFVNEVESDIP